MRSYTSHLVGLAMFCVAFLLLIACRAKIAESPGMPTEMASPTVTIPLTHAFPNTHTPTPPATPTSAKVDSPPGQSGFIEHIVQPGDTLLGIALQYDLPIAAIQLQNDLGSSTVVRVGQTLAIPPRAAWEGASRFWVVHVVQPGETVVGIAEVYGLTPEALEAANGLPDSDYIVVGQELILPLETLDVTLASSPVPIATPVPSTVVIPTVEHTTEPLEASPPPTAVPTNPLPAAPPPADVADWPRDVFRLINEVRAQHGLSPLAYSETLANVAQAHANDCLQRGWGSHYGSDGSNVKTRMERAGYDPVRWSECWAHTQSPQSALAFWMDETPPNDPHRRTILSTWLTEVGIGVVEVDWGYYIFADFGQSRD